MIRGWGFAFDPAAFDALTQQVGEHSLLSRTGGAPSLAVGMAEIFSSVLGGPTLKALWYHFAIMFEALFILTTLDAGTRVGRFMVQDLLGNLHPALGKTSSLPANLLASGLIVAAWGYFLYQGVVDPLGGINSLWPLFGIANQLLAATALACATTILVKSPRPRWAFATGAPLAWLLAVTMSAGWLKIFAPDRRLGFLAQADFLGGQIASGAIARGQGARDPGADLQRAPRRRADGSLHDARRDRRARRRARLVADAAAGRAALAPAAGSAR